jgi:fluoride exporter
VNRRTLLAIAVGGALGGIARYGVDRAVPWNGRGFPWDTFAVNVAGSLLLGLIIVFALEIWQPYTYVRPFAAVGFCGAFTTFSTYAVETDQLARHHHVGLAAGYTVASLVAALAAVAIGIIVGRLLTRPRDIE